MASYCQSCGMPVSGDAEWGTELYGTRSADYCASCYQKGEFTEPGITMDQMIERVASRMRAMNFPEKMIDLNAKLLPSFKRWTKAVG
jgi:Putative zinc ribbon domain